MNFPQTSTRFLPVQLHRGQFSGAAMRYIGLDYSEVNHVEVDANCTPRGTLNCYGVLLLALRDCGLLPDDFDLNLAPSRFGGQRPAKTLWHILHENFDEVPKTKLDGTPNLEMDDVLLFRWLDVNNHLHEPHHVAQHLGASAHDPYGQMIHALEWESGGGNSVFAQRLSELDWRRLDTVHRLKAEFRAEVFQSEDRVLDVAPDVVDSEVIS